MSREAIMSEHNKIMSVRRAAGIDLPKPVPGCYHVGIEISGEGKDAQISVWLLPPELEGASLVRCTGNAFTFRLRNGTESAGCAEIVCRPELDPELGQVVQFTDPPT